MRKKGLSPKVLGLLVALLVFGLLSALAGGVIEFSMEMGFGLWLWETLAYAVTNKLLEKLLLSAGAGLVCAFVASMVQYGRQVKSRRGVHRTRVRFTQVTENTEDDGARRAG